MRFEHDAALAYIKRSSNLPGNLLVFTINAGKYYEIQGFHTVVFSAVHNSCPDAGLPLSAVLYRLLRFLPRTLLNANRHVLFI